MEINLIFRFFSYFFLLVILVPFFLVLVFNNTANTITLATEAQSVSVDTLKRYPQDISIVTSHKLVIDKPDFWSNFFSPHESFTSDPLRILLSIIFLIILLISFSDFNYQKPFTKRTTLGVHLMFYTILFFVCIYLLRNMWFIERVHKITGEEFRFTGFNILAYPEFWLAFVLQRVARVFKKGRRLQEEQDLTV